jgi:hypothetical protein
MDDHTSSIFEIVKWAWPLVVAPVLGWFGGLFAARRQLKRRKKAIIRELSGLPIECKAILANFHDQRAHTLRTDPGSPPMLVLMQRGIAKRGPGGGTYEAVDCYVSIRSDIWEAMDDWIVSDLDIITIRAEHLSPESK